MAYAHIYSAVAGRIRQNDKKYLNCPTWGSILHGTESDLSYCIVAGCLQLLEILDISWSSKLLLEILEISWNLVDALGKIYNN